MIPLRTPDLGHRTPDHFRPEQLDFPSLSFPADRRVLTVKEVALRWNCSEQHIIDLLEAGLLDGFDIACPHDFVRVPRSFLESLAARLRCPLQDLLDESAAVLPPRRTARAHWRIPVEGHLLFIRQSHSRNRC